MQGFTAKDGALQMVSGADEAPKQGEIGIRVRAAGVNRADLMQKAGNYPPPPGASEFLGLECSGTVEAVGDGVTEFSVGQPVCALLSGGGYADTVICPAAQVLPVPAGMDLLAAGGLPEIFATAWLNLFMEGALQPNERVLIHAGGSGVGTAAIQLCKAFDNPCFVTAGTANKIARCLELGASAGAVRGEAGWADAVHKFAPEGVHLVLDPVGANYLADNLKVLAVGGRLVLIGLMGGHQAQINLAGLLVKRQRLIGSALRTRPVAEKGRIMEQLRQYVWPHLETGAIVPIIDKVWPFKEAEAAQQYMAANQNFGKILLEFPQP